MANVEMLTLQHESGSIINIPKEWTDLAEPNPYQTLNMKSTVLSYDHLTQLTELVSKIKKNEDWSK
ncbi:MAG: DUF5372 family protein [Gammaproteobacteria bacterium]|nr:DUF5372 family protein [Gammaproteobacteria bacterium]